MVTMKLPNEFPLGKLPYSDNRRPTRRPSDGKKFHFLRVQENLDSF